MANENATKENIMGKEGITPLLFRISLPLMISMLVQALYNLVDSMFVARLSETALTAVSLAFPLQNLLIAFGVGTGVGMASFLSRKLGERDEESATKVAGNGISIASITWAVFAVLGLTVVKPFLNLFSDDAELLGLSTGYSEMVMVFSLFMFLSMMNERILQGTGDSFSSMLSQMTGAITNIILDPIFIFTLGFGVNGAAIATVIGQGVGCAVSFVCVIRNKFIHIEPRHLKIEKRMVKAIYAVGAPTIITNSIGTVMTGAIHAILISFSTTAVSIFSVYFKLQSFVFMPIFGLSSGMVPIIAYNYGARKRKRVTETIWKGTFIASVIMILGTLAFNFFPRELLSLFSATEEMYRIGIPALKMISLCFVPAAISIGLGSSFQATGYGVGTMIVSICRQLMVLIPVAYILSIFLGINGVWLSFIVAEIIGLVVSIAIYLKVYSSRIRPIEG